MFRRNLSSLFVLVLILSFALSACSSPLASTTVLPQAQSTSIAQQSITSKLGIGILKMEGTSQAVTATQASTLLPLWKAVYKMGNDKSASKIEVAALYDQIQETLTTDQVSSIQKITYTQTELADLIQKYGSNATGLSASVSSSSTSSSSQAGAGGPPDLGGGPGGDILSVGGSSSSSTNSSKSSGA
jgi:hypothetical protein